MGNCKVYIPRGERSNWGMVDPLIKRIKEDKDLEFVWTLYESDITIINADREEMLDFALTCFKNNIPIGHLYAGILNSMATKDDYYRHIITLISEIQFCESKKALMNVHSLLNSIDKQPNAYIIPITHLENIKLSYEKVPEFPFDLVLYNPIKNKEQQKEDIKKIETLIHDHNVVTIGNPDEFIDIYTDGCFHTHHNNLDRNQFLGLLNKCSRYITNSSSVIYEKSIINKKCKIIEIGDRNSKRSTKWNELKTEGGSLAIIEIIKKWWINKNGE